MSPLAKTIGLRYYVIVLHTYIGTRDEARNISFPKRHIYIRGRSSRNNMYTINSFNLGLLHLIGWNLDSSMDDSVELEVNFVMLTMNTK